MSLGSKLGVQRQTLNSKVGGLVVTCSYSATNFFLIGWHPISLWNPLWFSLLKILNLFSPIPLSQLYWKAFEWDSNFFYFTLGCWVSRFGHSLKECHIFLSKFEVPPSWCCILFPNESTKVLNPVWCCMKRRLTAGVGKNKEKTKRWDFKMSRNCQGGSKRSILEKRKWCKNWRTI